MEEHSPVRYQIPVSVIVPARNEEACLATCLRSLLDQRPSVPNLEIIVVDDGSTDRTRAIAESFLGVRVISPPPLPPGWSGKSNAVSAGAQAAHGEWLLFTDADTLHRPGSLARAQAEASEYQAALLSYSPQQDVRGIPEKAVMAVIFAELAATYRPSEVSDPLSPVAAANGQYLLIRRDIYQLIGGHAAVATTLLEDVALAKLVKQSGHKLRFRYAPDAVETRMYRTFSQLLEGWTKNLAALFPSSYRLALLRAAEFSLILGSAGVAISSKTPALRLESAAIFTTSFTFFWKRIRRAHFSWDASLLAFFGLPIFSYLLLRSTLSYVRGNVTWKGRTYGSSTLAPDSENSWPASSRINMPAAAKVSRP